MFIYVGSFAVGTPKWKWDLDGTNKHWTDNAKNRSENEILCGCVRKHNLSKHRPLLNPIYLVMYSVYNSIYNLSFGFVSSSSLPFFYWTLCFRFDFFLDIIYSGYRSLWHMRSLHTITYIQQQQRRIHKMKTPKLLHKYC